jgi:hypothetical protein
MFFNDVIGLPDWAQGVYTMYALVLTYPSLKILFINHRYELFRAR